MGFKYLIKKHVGKGMMVQTFQDGILKSNHILLDEIMKWRKTCTIQGQQKITCHFEVSLEREGVVDSC
jgi:hypothetical protein